MTNLSDLQTKINDLRARDKKMTAALEVLIPYVEAQLEGARDGRLTDEARQVIRRLRINSAAIAIEGKGLLSGDAEEDGSSTGLSSWQAFARRRWPDAMDMVAAVEGTGRYATVAWCAGLTVTLWSTRKAAESCHIMNGAICGHGCWHDHEVADLAGPELVDEQAEEQRMLARVRHFEGCRICQTVYSGKAPTAAVRRWVEKVAAGREVVRRLERPGQVLT